MPRVNLNSKKMLKENISIVSVTLTSFNYRHLLHKALNYQQNFQHANSKLEQ